jgi:DNA-binding transcriptional regulator PaaX
VQTVSDAQRRARLGVRQALASRASGVVEAVRATTCLHATEPPTVYLSVVARSDATREDVDRELYAERSIVRQLAMRRTLFVFPRDLLPHAWGGPSARVTQQLTTRLAKEVQEHGLADDGAAWVAEQLAAVRASLLADGPATTTQLRDRVPALARPRSPPCSRRRARSRSAACRSSPTGASSTRATSSRRSPPARTRS